MSSPNLAVSRLSLLHLNNENGGRPRSERSAVSSVPIIAICHLSWDWVWQRPQQFLSRHAITHPLLFVETHCSDVTESHLHVRTLEGSRSVTVVQTHLPASRWHDGNFIDLERRRLLQQFL